MPTSLPRQSNAVATGLLLNTLMIGGVAVLFGVCIPRATHEHACSAAASWVALT